MGLFGAFLMGGIVFMINYFSTYLTLLSLIAGLKQAVYTFFLGGAVFRATEYLATNIQHKTKAILAGAFIPFFVTLLLVFGLHNMRGTPRPLESTLPTVFVFTGTLFWAIIKRRAMEKRKKLEKL